MADLMTQQLAKQIHDAIREEGVYIDDAYSTMTWDELPESYRETWYRIAQRIMAARVFSRAR